MYMKMPLRIWFTNRRIKICITYAATLWLALNFIFNLRDAQSHAGFERSNPPKNSRLAYGKVPSEVQVWFTELLEPRFSELKVLNSNGQRVDASDSRVPANDPKSLVVTLKSGLPDGPYTVVYNNTSAEDGHILKGSYSFVVGAGNLTAVQGQNSPLDLAEQGSDAGKQNANFWSISLRWLNYLAGAALLGSIVFCLMVWRVVIKKLRVSKNSPAEIEALAALGYARALTIARYGLAGLLLGWLGWMFYQAGAVTSQSLWQLLGFDSVAGKGPQSLIDLLVGSRYGVIWSARLLLLLLLGAVIGAASHRASSTLDPTRASVKDLHLASNKQQIKESALAGNVGRSSSAGVILLAQEIPAKNPAALITANFEGKLIWWWIAVILSAAVLLTTSLNSHAASNTGLTWRSVSFDWLHLISTGLWAGSIFTLLLVTLAVLPILKPGSGDRTRLLANLIPAFSQVAVLCVLVLVITGTFNAFQQLSSPSELFTTGYGISLLVKIILTGLLMALAGYNRLLVQSRVQAFAKSKKHGPDGGPGSLAAGALGLKFRYSVLAEGVLLAIVLLAAAFLTSNPPPKSSQVGAKVFYMRAEKSDFKLDLAVSPALTGDNSFEARISDKSTGRLIPDVRLVSLRLAMQGMDMGNAGLELRPVEGQPGRYLGQSSILSMVGDWRFDLLIQRDGHEDVNFPVEIKIK